MPPPLKIRFADCQGRLSPSVLAFARTAPSSEGANEALRYYTGRRCVEVSVANVILRKFSAGKFSASTALRLTTHPCRATKAYPRCPGVRQIVYGSNPPAHCVALAEHLCRAARPRVALSESNVVSEDNRDTKRNPCSLSMASGSLQLPGTHCRRRT